MSGNHRCPHVRAWQKANLCSTYLLSSNTRTASTGADIEDAANACVNADRVIGINGMDLTQYIHGEAMNMLPGRKAGCTAHP